MDGTSAGLNDKKVMITGGGGYLGSKLAERLAHSGIHCFLLDNIFNSTATNLSSKFRHVHLVSADITDLAGLKNACRTISPHRVFHFAASIDRTRDFSRFGEISEINVTGTLNLLEALDDVAYEAFCFSGSSEVYGNMTPVPFSEEQLPVPVSPYSLTKLMAEELIKTWSGIHKKPFMIFRIFLFMGTGMPPVTFLAQLKEAMVRNEEFRMTGGRQKRDYLLLEDLLYCIDTLSKMKEASGETINLCSGNSVSIKEIADTVREITGNTLRINHSLPYRENEIWEIRGSNEKLKKILTGFEPQSFLKGIHSLFEK
ncbi:MAG: SDR family NAD(P)-dependent oxidoreductase [Bacteroidales bacterium]|nr:SDR family NAD(P)-dependent oxidoreductase [Bacteroidales bacterium]